MPDMLTYSELQLTYILKKCVIPLRISFVMRLICLERDI